MLRCLILSTLFLACVGLPCVLDRDELIREWAALNASKPPPSGAGDLPLGPYKPNFGKIKKLPGLTDGAPYSAAIVWPSPQSKDEKFPVLSFAHGTLVGSVYPESATAYKQVFEAVASFGFIIVAPDSCPAVECFSAFSHDQIAALKAVKEDTSLHPSLATADFSRTGVFGHSMGAMSSIVSDGGGVGKPIKPSEYNIKAAVSMHTCQDTGISAGGTEMPILFTTGSADKICGSGCSDRFYSGVKHPSKALFNIVGASHFEPSNLGDASERYAIAYWFACHVKGEQCDRVYGSNGKALCDQLPAGHSLAECKVEGGPSPPSPTPPAPPSPPTPPAPTPPTPPAPTPPTPPAPTPPTPPAPTPPTPCADKDVSCPTLSCGLCGSNIGGCVSRSCDKATFTPKLTDCSGGQCHYHCHCNPIVGNQSLVV